MSCTYCCPSCGTSINKAMQSSPYTCLHCSETFDEPAYHEDQDSTDNDELQLEDEIETIQSGLALNLIKLREEAGVSSYKLACETELSPIDITNLEDPDQPSRIEKVIRYCEYFDVDVVIHLNPRSPSED